MPIDLASGHDMAGIFKLLSERVPAMRRPERALPLGHGGSHRDTMKIRVKMPLKRRPMPRTGASCRTSSCGLALRTVSLVVQGRRRRCSSVPMDADVVHFKEHCNV